MKRSILAAGELSLVAIIFYTSYLLVVPWREKPLETRREKNRAEESNATALEEKDTARDASPERVAHLFGWKMRETVREKVQETVSNAVETKTVREPEPLTWLKPVGSALDSGNIRYQFFKDERTKRVLKLAVGTSDNGWKMIETTGSEFVLEFGGKLYSVKRNQ
jgi:hypothetical protein